MGPLAILHISCSCQVDLLFKLTEQADSVLHKGFADKWHKRIIEAYQVANKNSLLWSSKGSLGIGCWLGM